MRSFELSPRLQSLADLVPQGAVLTDVGTDHAFLPVWLLLQGRISRAIAADLHEGPLENARKTADHCAVADRISFRLCDGLSGIAAEETDCIAIAGMGGETIAEILQAATWTAEGQHRFLLQPMTGHAELRTWLSRNGFSIAAEQLTREGRSIYLTLLVTAGHMIPLTPGETWGGRQSAEMVSPLRSRYLARLILRADKAVLGAEQSSKSEDALRADGLRAIAAGLKDLKKEWDAWQA
ncbi:MAG: class I SAM-dependent methyltransferase [Pseudoflavonifractor sp.]